MKRYETSFHVKTDGPTKKLIEQILFKMMTAKGHFVTKAEVFGTLVAKWAKMEGINGGKHHD
jgi:hypothetical protein